MFRFRSLLGRAARRLPALGRVLDERDRALHELRRTRAKLSAARVKAQAHTMQLRQRVDRLETATRDLKATTAARTLAPVVLEQTIAVRHAALLQSSSRRKTAEDFEARLLDRSAAYRDARELGTERTAGCDGPIDVHGLRWWIPHQGASNTPGLEGRLRNGRLPFKSILAGRELAHGTIMLDIGANVGTTSIPRVVLGDFQHVYAAEPEPRNYMCLVQNVLANDLGGFVLPDRVAIGSQDGELTMRLATNIGAHRVLSGDPRRSRPNRVVVPVRRLDTWVETLGIEPAAIAFIKCDVQGWELRVMEGASRMLLQRHIAWQFEVSPKHLENAGTSLAEFCDTIRRSFDCFIDLTGQGRRTRTTKELHVALGDLGTVRRFTDILAYNTAT